MAKVAGHLSDAQLGELADVQGRVERRFREHVRACEACRRRLAEVIQLREALAQTGQRERRPQRDVVPSVMMRLRLRRHSVTNANELFESFAALVRGLTSLFSLPARDQRSVGRARGAEEEQHE